MTITWHHCIRPCCGRKLTAKASQERGYGPKCWSRLLKAIRVLEASGNKVAIKAADVLRDRALIPMTHTAKTGVWACAGASGNIWHCTVDFCTCWAGRKTIPVMCNHRTALAVLVA
jgi:hypothetical protein